MRPSGNPGRRDGGNDEPLRLPLSEERRVRIEGIAPNMRPRDEEDHLGLWLDKFVVRNPRTWKIEKDDRAKAFGRFCKQWKSNAGEQAEMRQAAMLTSLHGKDFRRFEANITGRLLIGQAQATATEAAVCLHRMWGVPRIPGSALKGVARAHASLEGEWTREQIERCFGSEPEAKPLTPGTVAFYDALPVGGKFELAMDVLTPHHQGYYEGKGKEPPVEWEDPIPVTFLSVANTRFVFSIGALPVPGEKPDAKKDARRLDEAVALLKSALENHGVGGKTAAGYGYFGSITDVSNR